MATIKKTYLVCDVGLEKHGVDNVRSYAVSVGGQRSVLTLCEKCAKPIADLLAKHGKQRKAGSRRARVLTLDELEKRKSG